MPCPHIKASLISNSWIYPTGSSGMHLYVSSRKRGFWFIAVQNGTPGTCFAFVYAYVGRTVRALVPTAKTFCALSSHVAGAADSGNTHRCVVCWPRSSAFWRNGVESRRGGSYPHSRCGHATGSTGVYPSPTRGKEARRIRVREHRKGGGTLAHSVCYSALVAIESSLRRVAGQLWPQFS